MARIRTIKPEFFLSEDIGELTVISRLLYVALWCHADREGKMKFQRVALASQCLPYEFDQFDASLDELMQAGLVVMYEVEGKKYLYIPTFTEHQRPHHTEKESTLPPYNGDLTVKAPLVNRKEGKGREGKGSIEPLSGKPDELDEESPSDAIDYLNEKTGKSFQHTEANLKLVRGRMAEKFTLDDIRWVVDAKVAEWRGTKEEKYLRPATLFNAEKFNQYIGERKGEDNKIFKYGVLA